jgi:hypothetical protein
VNCPIAQRFSLRLANDSAIGDGVLTVGVANVHYVLKFRDTQYRTLAVRKFSARNDDTAQFVRSNQRLTGSSLKSGKQR